MDWLTASHSFCLVVQHGSFTRAAQTQDISASAMSKRIDWLEKQLGLSLLVRTTRQVSLTEAGLSYRPRAQALVKQFNEMISETQQYNATPSGLLKISAPQAIGSTIVMPHIQAFQQQYPKVCIQLDVLPLASQPDLDHDLIICRKRDNFDSANHKGSPLLTYAMGLFAAPAYLQRHPPINTIEDLAQHKMLISGIQKSLGLERMANGEDLALDNYGFISNNIEALLYGAVNEMGITFAPPEFIKSQLDNGLLVQVLPKQFCAPRELWCFYPKTEFMPLKSRLFLDFIKERV